MAQLFKRTLIALVPECLHTTPQRQHMPYNSCCQISVYRLIPSSQGHFYPCAHEEVIVKNTCIKYNISLNKESSLSYYPFFLQPLQIHL